jgi:hypothetical protein
MRLVNIKRPIGFSKGHECDGKQSKYPDGWEGGSRRDVR